MPRRSPPPRREPPADLDAALEVAFRFLAPRPRSSVEVARRLRRAGADEMLVEACLKRLGELGYLDDREFVRYWIEQRDTHAPRGRALIDAELRRLGVDRDAVRLASAERESAEAIGEEQRAVRALSGRLRGRALDGSDRVAVKRAADFLARRGFGYEVARAAIRRMTGGPAEDTDDSD